MWKAAFAGALTAVLVIAGAVGLLTDGRFIPGQVAASRASPPPMTAKSAERQQFFLSEGVPAPYGGRRNGLRRSVGNLIEGARLYDLNCAACHGTMGIGDGVAGEDLATAPADLAASLADQRHGDDYFLWTMSEGGQRFGTDMPAYRNDLSEQDMWRIMVFLRAVIDESGAAGQGEPPPPR